MKSILLVFLIIALICTTAYAMSQEEEIRLGHEAVSDLRSKGFTSEPILDEVGKTIAEVVDRKDLPWHFWVLEEPEELNAFALPGGFAFITRRYYEMLTADELAFIVGHEMAHIDKYHFHQKLRRARRVQLYEILAGIIIRSTKASKSWNTVADAGGAAYFSKYSRKIEREADLYGYQYTRAAGFDAEKAISALDKLGKDRKDPIFGTIFSSHPVLSSREDRLEAIAQAETTPAPPPREIKKEANPDWQYPQLSRDELKLRPGIAVRVIGENRERWDNAWRSDFRSMLFRQIELAGKYDVRAEDSADGRREPKLSELKEKYRADKFLVITVRNFDAQVLDMKNQFDREVQATIRLSVAISDTATAKELRLEDVEITLRGSDFLPQDSMTLYPDMTISKAALEASRQIALRVSNLSEAQDSVILATP